MPFLNFVFASRRASETQTVGTGKAAPKTSKTVAAMFLPILDGDVVKIYY